MLSHAVTKTGVANQSGDEPLKSGLFISVLIHMYFVYLLVLLQCPRALARLEVQLKVHILYVYTCTTCYSPLSYAVTETGATEDGPLKSGLFVSVLDTHVLYLLVLLLQCPRTLSRPEVQLKVFVMCTHVLSLECVVPCSDQDRCCQPEWR